MSAHQSHGLADRDQARKALASDFTWLQCGVVVLAEHVWRRLGYDVLPAGRYGPPRGVTASRRRAASSGSRYRR